MDTERQSELDGLFEELFNAYRSPILNYIYRLVDDSSCAEELCQEVFLRAYKALGRLSADANHRAWLYRIATNAAYDKLRRRKLIKWLPLMDNDGSTAPVVGPERLTVEHQAMEQALRQVPSKYRGPLLLYTVQGYSLREIGEIMGISEGAVKTRLFRAREKLRVAYGGDR